MLTLKSALLVNGISSGVTGIALIIFADNAAALFEVSLTSAFLYTGIFLVLFAMFVVKTAVNKNIGSASLKFISTLDIAWVLASIALLIADGAKISLIGNVMIIAVAGWVGLMALLQVKTQKNQVGAPGSPSVA